MKSAKKVYDFPFEKVKDQVTNTLKKNRNRATVADLVGQSGLPAFQVQSVLPTIVDECRGRLQVTESGEILYDFPQGLVNQIKGFSAGWKRFWKGFAKGLAIAARFLFKAWIVVMLVGYFALFVLILLVALLVAIGLSFAKRDDRDSGSGGAIGFVLVARIFEFFFLLWAYSGDPIQKQEKKKKPFYKAVFEFVFGVEENPSVREKQERKAFISLVKRNNGIATVDDVMILTGKTRDEADRTVSRLLLEYEGEPKVSERGTLYFFFPELLRTAQVDRAYQLAEEPLIPFTRNPKKTNRWIAFLNGFNVVLAAYFIGFSVAGTVDPNEPLSFVYLVVVSLLNAFAGLSISEARSWVFGVLGLVPGLYSLFFFGIPWIRRLREKTKNESIKVRNFARTLWAQIVREPIGVDLRRFEPTNERNALGTPGVDRETKKERLLRDFAGPRSIDVQEIDRSPRFSIPEILEEQKDLDSVKSKVDLGKYKVGEVIFDTDSDKID